MHILSLVSTELARWITTMDQKSNTVVTAGEVDALIDEAGVSRGRVWDELAGGDRCPCLRSAVESAIESAIVEAQS